MQECAFSLIFAKQKMGAQVNRYLNRAQVQVRETLEMTGVQYSVILLDEYDAGTDRKGLERGGAACRARGEHR